MRRLLLLILAVPLLAVPAAATGSDDLPVLVATVGPGFTIDLADSTGKHLDVVTAGSYTLLVHDRSDQHDFHVANKPDGRRLDLTSGVPFVGDATYTITLEPGLYGYACTPHWQVMNGGFAVVPERAPTAPERQLRALVATTGAVSLQPRPLTAGDYAITVRDRSAKANFHLSGPGVNRRTSLAFVGTRTWHVHLAKGVYRAGNDNARARSRLVVR
jgi:hypothetical protein